MVVSGREEAREEKKDRTGVSLAFMVVCRRRGGERGSFGGCRRWLLERVKRGGWRSLALVAVSTQMADNYGGERKSRVLLGGS